MLEPIEKIEPQHNYDQTLMHKINELVDLVNAQQETLDKLGEWIEDFVKDNT